MIKKNQKRKIKNKKSVVSKESNGKTEYLHKGFFRGVWV